MIEVRIQALPGGRISGVEVTGHSGRSRKGSDILCAAVSVLAENLAASLKVILNLNPEIESGDGLLSVSLDPNELSSQTDLLFASLILGMKALEASYPENIRLETGNSSGK